MPTAEAHIPTERASRYLVQFCRHAGRMGHSLHRRPRAHEDGDAHTPPEVRHAEWSDTQGIVILNWGQCTLRATPDRLTLHAEGATPEDLQRMRDLIARRLETIGRRDRLTVAWQGPDTSESGDPRPAGQSPTADNAATRRGHVAGGWSLKAAGVVVVLFVVAHLVIGGSVLAATRWLGWGAGVVAVAFVVVKVVGLGGLAARHGHRRRR
jgi:hypothetical protein